MYNPPLHLVVVSLDPICNVGIETGRTTVEMVRTGRGGTDPASLLEMAGLAVADVVKVLVRSGPAMEPAMIDEIAAVGLQTR